MSNSDSDSVFKDWRGEIQRHELNGIKYNVLFTRKGCYRSGDFHPANQFDLILLGHVRITTREHDNDVVREYNANQLIKIPENIPHLFEFLSGCVMIEWWDRPFEAKYYPPYRIHVIEQEPKEYKGFSCMGGYFE